jgi:hypothetical protein
VLKASDAALAVIMHILAATSSLPTGLHDMPVRNSKFSRPGRIVIFKAHKTVFGMNPLHDHAPASFAPIDSFRNPRTKVFLCLRNEFRFTTALSLYNSITTPFTTPFTTLFHFVLLLVYYSV